MSTILKGLNESTHNKYNNNRTGFSRGPRDDERHDLDVQKPTKEEWALKINGKVWSKDGKTVTFASKEQALKARESLLAKRPELEVGLVTRSVTESFTNSKSMITETRTYKLWESAGKKLYEAQLTQDQINQIFQYVEKIQTAGGSNRTMLGKGKDAAGAVGKAWEELKTKVQNSGPVKGFDVMYDKAAEQLKQATGGDQGVMKYVQKYRDFAKKHPVAQSLIYATLIAAAGISGAGVGGAAALGLFKMADKLLQGEKFSSAAYQGAKTGGMAYAAGQIGQAMQGGDTATTTTSTTTSTAPGITGDMSYDQAYSTYIQKFAQDPNNPSAMIVQQAKQFAATKAKVNESIELTESQIYLMIGKIVERQRKLDEGIMDTVKGVAGKAMNWAQTKGTNLTTKITADKLLQAWKKAGSPMDSLDVASIVQQAGVPSDTIKQVYGNMKIPFAGEAGAGANTERKIDVDKSSVVSTVSGSTSQPNITAPADATTDTTAAPAGQAVAAPQGSPVEQVQQLVKQLSVDSKKRLVKKLRTELGIVSEDELSEAGTGLDIDRSIPGRTIARISGTSPNPAIGKLRHNPLAKKLPDFYNDNDEHDQWSGKVGASIHDDEEDTFDKDYMGDEEDELNEISNEKLGQYKTAAALDAGKADKHGDYNRADKRFSGIVKATKKQFANDTKKSSISQGINEFVVTGGPKGPKDYGQPNSSRYIGGNKFVVGTTNNYVLTATIDKWGLEWDEDDEIWFLDSPGAAHIADASEGEIELPPPREQRNQIHDLVTDYLNERNSADLQKVAAYYGHSDDGEMATNEGMVEADEKPADPFKTGYPRVKSPQILGTKNRAKSAYYPPTKTPIKKLDKPLPESLGDELKSKSIQALQQVKQQLEQQRMADLEQWEKDFKQNTVAKFTAREPNLKQRVTSTPTVAMPGEKHSALKSRLAQLDKAIEQQGILDKLVEKLDKKGLLTPTLQAAVDTSMLVRDGARDNYVSLNAKLNKAVEYVKNRLGTNKAAFAKPKSIDEDDSVPTRMRMNDYYDLADAIQEKLRHAIQLGDKARIQQLSKERDELDAHVKKHGMMPEGVAEAELDENCWKGYHKEGNKELFGKNVPNCVKNEDVAEEKCPHCGGPMFNEMIMNEKKDACYYKVKSRYKVWPSAYASGALVKCRKKGASNWGNNTKNESSILEGLERADENLHQWFKEKWVRFGPDGKIRGDCARGDDSEGKPKCLPQSKAQNLGKKGRASAAARKRREDPNPERHGKAINVNTKKKSNEDMLDEKWSQKYKDSINCSNPKGFSQKAHCASKKK